MTTEQEKPAQKPNKESPRPKRRRTSDTHGTTGKKPTEQSENTPQVKAQDDQSGQDQAEAAPEQPAAGPSAEQPTAEGAPPGRSGMDLGPLLQQQIAQALQPVLADFRQQIKTTVQQQIEGDRLPGTVTSGAQLPKLPQAPEQQSKPDTENAPQPEQEEGASQSTSQQAPQEARGEASDQGESQQSEPQTPEDGEGSEESTGHGLQKMVRGKVGTTLSSGLHLVERQGEEWLVSMLTAGLTALLSEATHGAVQRRAEQSLHALLQKAFDALPEGAAGKDLRAQTERTLQAILRETIDAMYAEGARSALEHHGAEAGRNLAHRDLGGVMEQIQQAGQALLHELVTVLRHQWQRILRLLLRLILSALQDSLAPDEKDSLTGLTAESGG